MNAFYEEAIIWIKTESLIEQFYCNKTALSRTGCCENSNSKHLNCLLAGMLMTFPHLR